MRSLVTLLLLTLFPFSSNTYFSEAASASPKPLILPIRQDAATKLLVADIYGRTPLVSNGFIVDLTAEHLWANCETNYQSSTFSQPKCGSPQCKTANTSYCFNFCSKFTRPFCHNNTCGRYLENPASHQTTIGEVSQDIISFRSTDGSKPGPAVQIPNFLFTCAPSALVDIGLPKGVQGVAGLAQGSIALHNQLASRVGFKPIFTLCIPSTSSGNGLIFFGSNGPYIFSGVDASKNLVYTPIIIDPFRQYYIHVKSISVDRKPVPINKSLLSVSNIGTGGGTTINTLLPYTILEGSIYKALLTSFAKQLPNIRPVKPIAPFGLCYESKSFAPSPLWPVVPSIDFELEGKGKVWSILGVNSMVEAKPGVLCLAFVNGGNEYRAAVNVGSHQMKDVIMEFDLSQSRLGIGYPLGGYRTGCHYFNFNIAA
ncbi:gamma conglutin 1-like [Silene latifolia]|uniref:gamma conglutin 1-like n=1 Tax=Silene latifolia TaxID=37657 RepID=UPI003D77389A